MDKNDAQPGSDRSTEAAAKAGSAQPLHTFQQDIALLMKTEKTSIAEVVQAEVKRRQERHEAAPSDIEEDRARVSAQTKLTLLATIGLGIVSLGTAGFVFWNGDSEPAAEETPLTLPSLIPADNLYELSLSTSDASILISRIRDRRGSAQLALGKVERVAPVIDEGKLSRPIAAQDFLAAVAPAAPESLVRSVDQNYFYGLTQTGYRDAFLILNASSYENAFSGMLEWERTLADDLAPLIARSTQAGKVPEAPSGDFLTELFDARDVQVLRDSKGAQFMVYAIIGKTIVIAGSTDSLKEALSRLKLPADR